MRGLWPREHRTGNARLCCNHHPLRTTSHSLTVLCCTDHAQVWDSSVSGFWWRQTAANHIQDKKPDSGDRRRRRRHFLWYRWLGCLKTDLTQQLSLNEPSVQLSYVPNMSKKYKINKYEKLQRKSSPSQNFEESKSVWDQPFTPSFHPCGRYSNIDIKHIPVPISRLCVTMSERGGRTRWTAKCPMAVSYISTNISSHVVCDVLRGAAFTQKASVCISHKQKRKSQRGLKRVVGA